MTDGFFSRPGIVDPATELIAPDAARIDAALSKAGVTLLAAILTAHSHHDHAMDTPVVASKTGAVIVGSESTANIARGLDFPESRIRVVRTGESFTFGRFQIRPIESPHAPGGMFMGQITEPLRPPAPVSAYKEGGNHSFLIEHEGRRVLIHPSANLTPGFLNGVRADVVFLGTAGLGKRSSEFAEAYWREVVETTGATLVIPIHWDNFFEPLDERLEPLPVPIDDFDRGMKALEALADAGKVSLRLPTAFETIDLSAPSAQTTASPPAGR